VKNEKEQHGKESNTEYGRRGIAYQDWRELAPQRATFEDVEHKTNSAGEKYPGHDRTWKDVPVSPQGDGKPGPVTPISTGKDGNVPKKRRHSIVDKYARSYDPVNSRVPDKGKEWTASAPTGSRTMYPNRLPELPANLRDVQIGWKKRYAHALGPDAQVADAMTAGNTPQRRKLRKTESK